MAIVRRLFAGALAAGVVLPIMSAGAEYFVYFGSYTGPNSKGIYVSRFDDTSSSLTQAELAGEIGSPSWITLHPNGRYLYAVTESGRDGTVTSFAIDPATGRLRELNKISTGGRMACHLAITPDQRTIFVANYGDGSVAGFQLRPDGSLGDRTAFIQHEGAGPDQKRQRGPHAHAVVISRDGRTLVVPDLGTDNYHLYRISATGGLTPAEPRFARVKGGSGPRHFAFHGNGKFGYGLNEMGSSVTSFSYADGRLQEIGTVSTLPAGFTEENNSAEIEVAPDGRFVYASNRGHDSIAVFAADPARGTLTEVQREPTQGRTPRNFSIAPGGRYLLAANQHSDTVVVFARDPKKGTLKPTGHSLAVPSPVCIQFLRISR